MIGDSTIAGLPLTLMVNDERSLIFRFDPRLAWVVGGANAVLWTAGACLQVREGEWALATLLILFGAVGALLIVQYRRRRATLEIDKKERRVTYDDRTGASGTSWTKSAHDFEHIFVQVSDDLGVTLRLAPRQGQPVRLSVGGFRPARVKAGVDLLRDVVSVLAIPVIVDTRNTAELLRRELPRLSVQVRSA
jgi:hypothetical protein